MKEIKAIISGRVQMVMYRDFVQRKARALWLIGTVENREDGTVEVIAQGSEEKLAALIDLLHKGPFGAKVLNVSVAWREPTETFRDFTILY